jgi:hypothetical protein
MELLAVCTFIGTLLTPLVPASKALRFMNTDCLAALRTGPPYLFVSKKLSYAGLFYIFDIVNHTHAILGFIALIQVVQAGAGETVATGAVPGTAFRSLITGLDSARGAGFRFEIIVTSATWACLPISHVGSAEATVHSTGSDQGRANRICHGASSLRHVRIAAKACVPRFWLTVSSREPASGFPRVVHFRPCCPIPSWTIWTKELERRGHHFRDCGLLSVDPRNRPRRGRGSRLRASVCQGAMGKNPLPGYGPASSVQHATA